MTLDLTKPIYVRQSQCSFAPGDRFIAGASYDAEQRAVIGLYGPCVGGSERQYMEAEIANCSNTPWETSVEKTLNDRIADLYQEARELLGEDSVTVSYLREILQRANWEIRFKERNLD